MAGLGLWGNYYSDMMGNLAYVNGLNCPHPTLLPQAGEGAVSAG